MRFSIITDIHHGPEIEYRGIQRKLSRYSIELLRDFVLESNTEEESEFVVNLGDMINETSPEVDVKNIKQILTELGILKCPVLHLVGNHEQWAMSVEELEKVVDQKPLYYSKDHGKYHLVALFSEDPSAKSGFSTISDEQKQWLKADLEQTSKKTIVFVHHSLADQDLTGNFWFEGKEQKALIVNRKEIRKILEDSGKVLAVFNGHVHWNHMDIHNDIPYFTINSLVENFNNDGIPSNCHAVVEVTDKRIDVDIKGNDKQHFEWGLG